MLQLPRHDDALLALKQARIPSQTQPGVAYALGRVLGKGAMSVAFFSLRRASDGQTPVVVKVMKPEIVADSDHNAALMVQKETVALGRLNEQVPPSPFVVRLIDTGSAAVMYGDRALELPWLAIEYVHGGAEGTTLEERVRYSIKHTGHAFDAERAARAVECIANGLVAIEAVGVVHRDVKPDNVLCCGFGEGEIFKIADFGIARPAGLTATFGGIVVGTPGYAPPEQFTLSGVGPWSDVFGMAGVIYFLLTGEEYFAVQHAAECVPLTKSPKRRRLSDASWLSPDLRDQPSACATIDAALARATAAVADHRPQSASVLAAMIEPALRCDSSPPRSVKLRLQSVVAQASAHIGGWAWTARHAPQASDRVIRDVAWSGDGHCLAVTTEGLAFWNGVSWQPVPPRGLAHPETIQFVHAVSPGVWMVGGDGCTIALYTNDGISKMFVCPDSSACFVHGSGDPNELAVFVATCPEQPPILYGLAAGHWIKRVRVSHAASISSLSRLDGERWLLAGRTQQGEGFVTIYSPLMWEIEQVKAPWTRAYLACATKPEVGVGVVVGASGQTVRLRKQTLHTSVVNGAPDLSAVALDLAGRAWAACTGSIWLQQQNAPSQWHLAWSDPQWQVPIVSLFADTAIVIGMTANGGIIEGRLEFAHS